MSNSYAHASLRIQCSLQDAKHIDAMLTFLNNQMQAWQAAPSTAEDLPSETAGWPNWLKAVCVELGLGCFELEQDYLSFDWRLDLPHVQGRPVESEQGFQGLMLEGDNVSDDLFMAAHLLLKALDSHQLISTGIAYTCDRSDEHAFAGNHVTITRHGWQFLVDTSDVIAAETEASENVSYWVLTHGPEAALWTTVAGTDTETVLSEARTASERLQFDFPDVITATPMPGSSYRHLKSALRCFESPSLLLKRHAKKTDNPTTNTRAA